MAKVRNCTKYTHWLPNALYEELRETSEIVGVPMSKICKRAIERELILMQAFVEAAKKLDGDYKNA
ncbi:MAG: hypothetical protein HN975_02155 [Anaerolineae bacterium]|jgi:hypothetical protein|nr:hypothetical protein [Anaerolineae bacterium]